VQTEQLIEHLSREAAPVPRHAASVRLVEGVAAGAALSFVVMWLWLGIRPDLGAVISTSPFWMKFGYTLLLAGIAFGLTERLGRPGARIAPWQALLFVPMAALFAMAVYRLTGSQPAERMHLIMGASANICPWRIMALALPIFAGACFGLRQLAPTRLIVAGAAAGLLAGAAGAWVYAFHCDESAAPFVAIWYTLGIALVGALGGVLGKWLLRWR
jgi:hypothetical protein